MLQRHSGTRRASRPARLQGDKSSSVTRRGIFVCLAQEGKAGHRAYHSTLELWFSWGVPVWENHQVAERVGFEPNLNATEAAAFEGSCKSESSPASSLASLIPETLREELSEIGEAWPKLPDSVRAAIRTLIRASKGGAQ